MKYENEIPRRNMLERNINAERLIYDALQEVEKLGCDERLTEVTILLIKAKDKLSDFVDENLTN